MSPVGGGSQPRHAREQAVRRVRDHPASGTLARRIDQVNEDRVLGLKGVFTSDAECLAYRQEASGTIPDSRQPSRAGVAAVERSRSIVRSVEMSRRNGALMR